MPLSFPQIVDVIKASFLFGKQADPIIKLIADRVDQVVYAENDILFEEGAGVEYLYLIASGRVRLYRTLGEEAEEFSILERGEMVGDEALGFWPERIIGAQAVTQVVLLRLSADLLEELYTKVPALVGLADLLLRSYSLASRLDFPWLGPREGVRYITRRHNMFLVLRLALPVLISLFIGIPLAVLTFGMLAGLLLPKILLGVIVLGAIGWIGWNILDWANDFTVITNRRVIFLERVIMFYDSRQEVPLDAVLANETITDQWGRWFGFGDIRVKTYTGTMLLSKVGQPQQVQTYLEYWRGRARTMKAQTDMANKEDTLRKRLGIPKPGGVAESGAVKPVVQQSALAKALSSMFKLRYEEGGNIIYRMHWLRLFQKIFLPTVCEIGLIVVLALGLASKTPLSPMAATGLVILIMIVVGLWWTYQYVDWRDDKYILTSDILVDTYKKPLGTEDKKTAPLKNIQSIDYERKGLIGLILNFGTVYIRIGETSFSFDDVPNPSQVQREIFQRFLAFGEREKQKEQMAQSQTLLEWLEAYHHVTQSAPPKPPGAG